jgi:hypothetical protein
MDKFVDTYDLLKLNQEDTKKLNRPIRSNERNSTMNEVNLIKVLYMHVCQYHNEILLSH